MKIINATIPADLSVYAIKEGLKQLENKDKNKVVLLTASNYDFVELFEILSEISFPYNNVDTSSILETDSWLLIDHENKTMYYSEGA